MALRLLVTEVHTLLAERVIEWTQQWKEQGLGAGRQEGQVQEARAMIIEVIRAQFRRVPRDMMTAIRLLTGLEALHELLRYAATCPTLDALQERLRTDSQHLMRDLHSDAAVYTVHHEKMLPDA